MSKKRVYEMARELNISNKVLLQHLSDLDIDVKSHMSTLTTEEADMIIELLQDVDGKSSASTKKKKEANKKKIEKDQILEEDQEEVTNKKKKSNDSKKEKNKHNNKKNKKTIEIKEKVSDQQKQKIEKKASENSSTSNQLSIEKEQPQENKKIEDDIIRVDTTIKVGDLASKLDLAASEVIMKLMKMGIMANINQEIKYETAEKIALDYDILIEEMPAEEEIIDITIEQDEEKDLVKRPPIVTIMGHVDHGKTSLLDAIRDTHVTDKEAGGITQHIGAYEVMVEKEKIVFLDTPGHEAFTEMRSRGAQVTDVAILVVAADDGIKPQTIEAINHARAAEVPIIVAINKMDKPDANVERVRQGLSEQGLLVEAWGGDVIDVPLSALTGENIDSLLEMILLVSEIQELKANPNRRAVGSVIESHLDKGRGPVATVIVSNGTLKIGEPVVAGATYGKVRAMTNDKGKRVKQAPPSTPVEIQGLNEVPNAGDQFVVMQNDKVARSIADKRKEKIRDDHMKASSKITLEDLFDKMQNEEIKELNIIIKADVQGSVEAIIQSLEKLSNEEVMVRVIHAGVGAITESDIMLASASNAIVIGFNVRPSAGATSTAEREQVDMRTYRIIYEAIDDIRNALSGMLDPDFKDQDLGSAEVRTTFKVPNVGVVAGTYVKSGKITRSAKVRLVRDGIVVYDGKIDSLKRFKDDAKEVAAGYECGIGLVNFNDIKEGDIIEAYETIEIKRTVQ